MINNIKIIEVISIESNEKFNLYPQFTIILKEEDMPMV